MDHLIFFEGVDEMFVPTTETKTNNAAAAFATINQKHHDGMTTTAPLMTPATVSALVVLTDDEQLIARLRCRRDVEKGGVMVAAMLGAHQHAMNCDMDDHRSVG
jgi:acetate kinase